MASTRVYGVPSAAYAVPASSASVYSNAPQPPAQTVHQTIVTKPAAPAPPTENTNRGLVAIAGVIVFLVIIFVVWWLVVYLIRPTGKANFERCTNSDQCQNYCDGLGLCSSNKPLGPTDPCIRTAECEYGWSCEPSSTNPAVSFCVQRPIVF